MIGLFLCSYFCFMGKWTFILILPYLLSLLLGTFFSILVFKKTKAKLWRKLSLILPFAIFGVILPIFPIYIEDYGKIGQDFKPMTDSNKIIEVLHKKSFSGLYGIVLPNCSKCHHTINQFEKLAKQHPKKSFLLHVFSKNSNDIQQINGLISAPNIHIELIPDIDHGLKINDNLFPSIYWVLQGNLQTWWTFEEFGYPAMDLVSGQLDNLD